MMRIVKKHWPKLALILACILAAYFFIQVDYHDDIGVTDIYFFNRFSVTYLYDVNEGPIFWLYDGKHFFGRWPRYEPKPAKPLNDLLVCFFAKYR